MKKTPEKKTLAQRFQSFVLRTTIGTPVATALGWIAYSNLCISHKMPLPPAVSGERKTTSKRAGPLSYYVAGSGEARPLLLIHSINAAASTYEMRPIFEHYRQYRRVYSIDMPGYGFSDRSDRAYTPRLFTDAILDMLDVIEQDVGDTPIDAMALSLGSEFLARAASEQPTRFHKLAMITPTGMRRKDPRFYESPGTVRGSPLTRNIFGFPLWSRALFDLLSLRSMQHWFLQRTFSPYIGVDAGLLDYDYLTTHQPGAWYAPYTFVSGLLFSADIDRVYDALTMPVWVGHGTFGEFSDVDDRRAHARGWKTRAFPTGALPHFEEPDQLFLAYDEFLQEVD
jgi:pimeloyl-ACP methyl ester carboxylesterase